jgi:hypothetical protein
MLWQIYELAVLSSFLNLWNCNTKALSQKCLKYLTKFHFDMLTGNAAKPFEGRGRRTRKHETIGFCKTLANT